MNTLRADIIPDRLSALIFTLPDTARALGVSVHSLRGYDAHRAQHLMDLARGHAGVVPDASARKPEGPRGMVCSSHTPHSTPG